MNSTPEYDVWDDWFSTTYGGTEEVEIESDVDEVVEDFSSFDDPESF